MRLAPLLPAALALLLASGPAPAQPTPPVAPAPPERPTAAAFVDGPISLTPAQAATFKAALDALAQQGHTCLIAEDAPLHPTLAPRDAPAVPDHTPLEQAVRLVADAYDYDVVRTGNVFTLTKRYSDPADLPDLTPEECAEDMHNVVLALGAFDPPAVWGGPTYGDPSRDRIAAILNALPPDQLRAVFSEHGLPIAQLGPQARAATDRWDLSLYLDDDLISAEQYEADAARADRAAVGVSTTPVVEVGHGFPPQGGETAFGQRIPWADGTYFLTFDDPPFVTGVTAAAGWTMTPGRLDAARARAAERKADGHESLTAAVAALAGRGGHYAVAAALAAKSVTAAGEGNAAPGAVMAGLARVYGLRAHARLSGGVLALDLPERVVPADVAGVWAVVRGLLPPPLVRACHLLDGGAPSGRLAQARQRLDALRRSGGMVAHLDEMLAAQGELTDLEREQRDEPIAVHGAAVWALRSASALYPASSRAGGLLPVSAMTADDRALYAASVMLPLLSHIRDLANVETVKPLTEEDQYVLTAKVYAAPDVRGTWKVNLLLNRPDPDGHLVLATGLMQVAYAGPPPPPGAVSPEDATAPAP